MRDHKQQQFPSLQPSVQMCRNCKHNFSAFSEQFNIVLKVDKQSKI